MSFKPCKEKIGPYLGDLIKNRFKSDRQFCASYLKLRDGQERPSPEDLQKMQNRICQIKKGNKGVQIEDLPIFSELLGVSFEEILSAGTVFAPTSNRKTNYSIAHSSDPAEWEAYIQREDKLILNPDEYDKTAIDYALEAGNYAFLKYLMEKGYIWFVGEDVKECQIGFYGFGAGTSIERREIGYHDILDIRLHNQDELRFKMITLAIRENDFEMLDTLHAREIPLLYWINQIDIRMNHDKKLPSSANVERMIEEIATSTDPVLSYFFEAFELESLALDFHNTFICPFAGQILDAMIQRKRTTQSKSFLEKAIAHNKKVWKRLQKEVATCRKEYEEYFANMNANYYDDASIKRQTWMDYYFYPETGFLAYSMPVHIRNTIHTGFTTNVIRVIVSSKDPEVQALIDKLNKTYDDFMRQYENKEA